MSAVKKIKESEIDESYSGCVYCGDPLDETSWRGCCGEIHYEQTYVVGDETYLESEVEIVADEEVAK